MVCLVYIHMQMKIFELSYRGKDKERIIYALSDTNGALVHEILTLKSANNLGRQLLDKENSLQFMGADHVMTVTAPQVRNLQKPLMPGIRVESPVWNIFSFLGIQEAKAWGKK